MKFFKARWAGILLAIFGLAAVLLGVRWWQTQNDFAPEVETARLTPSDFAVTIQARGVVEAAHPVAIRAPLNGTLLQVPQEVGIQMAAGDLLVAYKADDLRLQEEQLARDLAQSEAHLAELEHRQEEEASVAEAQLKQAEARFEQAKLDYIESRRLEPWSKEKALAEQQFQEAEAALAEIQAKLATGSVQETDLEAARSSVAVAQAALAQVRQQQSQIQLRAPASGTLLEIAVSAGETVTTGQLLVQMADLDAVDVVAQVDEVEIGQVEPGDKVEVVSLAFPDETFTGEVTAVAPTAQRDGNVAHFDVTIRVENHDHRLRPGMSTYVTIAVAQRSEAFIVPQSALVVRDGVNGLFVLDDGKARFLPVETGLVTETEVEIVSQLDEGLIYIVGPLPTLQELEDGSQAVSEAP